jgi:hypothetical protein
LPKASNYNCVVVPNMIIEILDLYYSRLSIISMNMIHVRFLFWRQQHSENWPVAILSKMNEHVVFLSLWFICNFRNCSWLLITWPEIADMIYSTSFVICISRWNMASAVNSKLFYYIVESEILRNTQWHIFHIFTSEDIDHVTFSIYTIFWSGLYNKQNIIHGGLKMTFIFSC